MAIAGINVFASQHSGALPPNPRSGAPPSSGACALCLRRYVPGAPTTTTTRSSSVSAGTLKVTGGRSASTDGALTAGAAAEQQGNFPAPVLYCTVLTIPASAHLGYVHITLVALAA